jgi:hypothetical protein
MPNPTKRDSRESTPGAPGLEEGKFEKMMGDLEGGIKANEKKKKKKKIRVKPLHIKATKRTPAQKPLTVSSALKREADLESGVTKPTAALRNAAASRALKGK